MVVASLAGCGGGDGGGSAFCEIACVDAFFTDAKECAGVTAGVACSGSSCYENGARTYLLAAELRAPDGALCLKRWSPPSGTAWQTGEQVLRFDVTERMLLCPDGSRHATTDPAQDQPSTCDPIDEPLRVCSGAFCGEAPLVCPAEGCLCRESECASAFFVTVRACAGLMGAETCAYDDVAGEACYSNGARVVGDAEERRLFAPDGTRCLTVYVGAETSPSRTYVDQRDNSLTVDETGMVVTCLDRETTQDACGSGARQNFEDSCDPSFIFDPVGCCAPGSCE